MFVHQGYRVKVKVKGAKDTRQDAQLSQRDRTAGCVIVYAKSKRLELGDNILRTL